MTMPLTVRYGDLNISLVPTYLILGTKVNSYNIGNNHAVEFIIETKRVNYIKISIDIFWRWL